LFRTLRNGTYDEMILNVHTVTDHLDPDNMSAFVAFFCQANGKNTRTLCQDGVPTQIKGGGNDIENTPSFVTTDIEACK
jgi:hypothetical protein